MSITFRTLESFTAQQIFDHVAVKLLEQNKQCTIEDEEENLCAYRSEDRTLKCAAGHLMSDAEAEELIAQGKNTGCGPLLAYQTLMGMPDSGDSGDMPHYRLIAALQGTHDSFSPKAWLEHLDDIASKHFLNVKVLEDWKEKVEA